MAQYKCIICGAVETLDHTAPDACSACGSPVFDLTRAQAIAAKNDAFRRSLFTGQTQGVPTGHVFMTRGIAAKSAAFRCYALRAVALQTTFTEDDDPHAEHDFGAVTIEGQTVWWKIDLYDQSLTYGTDDPLDDIKTSRVLTVLFPSEY